MKKVIGDNEGKSLFIVNSQKKEEKNIYYFS